MISLPAHCSTPMAKGVLAALIEQADRAADIVVDGARVDDIGQAVLQVLVCAKADADAAGRSFTIANPSGALIDRATRCKLDRLLGLAQRGGQNGTGSLASSSSRST